MTGDKHLDGMFKRLEDPRQWLRACLALATLVAGIKFVGIGYAHLCTAGSRWVESAGALWIPMAAGAAVWAFRRYRVGFAVAACLLAVDYLAREPYLQWVHARNSPWPPTMQSRR